MLPLEIKQSGGKLLPHSVLRGECFQGKYLEVLESTCEYGKEPSGSIKCGEFLD
jgi:hypothetical protein